MHRTMKNAVLAWPVSTALALSCKICTWQLGNLYYPRQIWSEAITPLPFRILHPLEVSVNFDLRGSVPGFFEAFVVVRTVLLGCGGS